MLGHSDNAAMQPAPLSLLDAGGQRGAHGEDSVASSRRGSQASAAPRCAHARMHACSQIRTATLAKSSAPALAVHGGLALLTSII